MKKILKKKDGYILSWLLCFFLIVSLLSVTTISFSLLATQSTSVQHNARQAQFTARSAVMATVDFISKNSSKPEVIEQLIGVKGTGNQNGMGKYEVEVSYEGENQEQIKVTAIGHFMGQSARTSAYLLKAPTTGGLIPTDNVIYVNEPKDGKAGLGQSNITGNIYINGGFTLGNGSSVAGTIVTKGDVTMSGDATSTINLFSFGDVTYTASGKLIGDLFAKGNIKVNGAGNIGGNAYADGDLDLTEGSGRIEGDAYIGGTASFAGGGSRILKSLYYYGNSPVFPPDRNIHQFIPNGDAVKMTGGYTPLDTSDYEAPDLEPISPPSQAEMPELYNTVEITNGVISKNGTIDYAAISEMERQLRASGIYYGGTITIDATRQDINLRIHNTHVHLPSAINLEVITNGENNVFIYMTGDSSFKVASNQFVGMQERGAAPQLYIFGDEYQKIFIENNSSLNACIYMPYGSLKASGSKLNNLDKLIGLCIVGTIDIESNVSFQYKKPPGLEDLPFDELNWGSYRTSSPWTIGRWGE